MPDAPPEVSRADLVPELAATVSVAPVAGEDLVFCADSPDWFGERVFGGIVVAQALNAATRTVGGTLRPHSLHGYFLRSVRAGPPVELRVELVRDGRSFTTRRVTTVQEGRQAFTAVCSFCADEDGDEYELAMDEVPGPDGLETGEWGGPFESRDLGPALGPDGTYRSTRRVWFGLAAPLDDDPALHASVLAFLSDMTGTSFRPHSLDTWGAHTDASLDHAVWFHRPTRADEWLFYDLHALVNAGGRSLVRGQLYTRDGRLCLSMAQELLIRRLPDGDLVTPEGPARGR